MAERNGILATGSALAQDIPEGDHAAGHAAALADALRNVDEADISDPNKSWEIGFHLLLEPGGSARVVEYRAFIRVPVADIDW
jgi:hypothetical protein